MAVELPTDVEISAVHGGYVVTLWLNSADDDEPNCTWHTFADLPGALMCAGSHLLDLQAGDHSETERLMKARTDLPKKG